MNYYVKTAVLLAAGRGKRLRPHTDQIPKALLSVDGRPMLDFVLNAATQAGIETVCLVTHHLGFQIEQFVGDGSEWGLSAIYSHQPHLAGTAHALQSAVTAHPGIFPKERPFLLTATDYILPPTYLADLIAAHKLNGTDITISLKKLPMEEIPGRSSVQFMQNGRIAQIIEKPSPKNIPSPFVASLTLVLPGSTLDYLTHMKLSPRSEFEIQSIINQMLQDGFTASGLVQEAPREWDESLND